MENQIWVRKMQAWMDGYIQAGARANLQSAHRVHQTKKGDSNNRRIKQTTHAHTRQNKNGDSASVTNAMVKVCDRLQTPNLKKREGGRGHSLWDSKVQKE
jgi:hypothetical protein